MNEARLQSTSLQAIVNELLEIRAREKQRVAEEERAAEARKKQETERKEAEAKKQRDLAASRRLAEEEAAQQQRREQAEAQRNRQHEDGQHVPWPPYYSRLDSHTGARKQHQAGAQVGQQGLSTAPSSPSPAFHASSSRTRPFPTPVSVMRRPNPAHYARASPYPMRVPQYQMSGVPHNPALVMMPPMGASPHPMYRHPSQAHPNTSTPRAYGGQGALPGVSRPPYSNRYFG